MRYGLISDVHANLLALRGALWWLREQGTDRVVCAGDVVGYGPQPNECIEELVAAGALVVAGNHDLMALGELDDAHEGDNVRHSTAWTRRVLGRDALAWLGSLPRVGAAPGLIVAHGSLEDPERYVERDAASAGQLDELARREPRARVLVLGHTHRARLYQRCTGSKRPALRGGRLPLQPGPALVNPGSVGQSRQAELEPRARCALLDLDSGPGPDPVAAAGSVSFYTLGYAVAECRRLLAEHGLPRSSIHLVPGRAAAAGRRLTQARASRGAHGGAV